MFALVEMSVHMIEAPMVISSLAIVGIVLRKSITYFRSKCVQNNLFLISSTSTRLTSLFRFQWSIANKPS
ncbi:hypothetical protein BDZ45DRAFT_279452 [Acephala macrosclerotiorum]|nr:hypothetical protein BDZ45DRAFT_279452 [Acephala macrosclerotiorum]